MANFHGRLTLKKDKAMSTRPVFRGNNNMSTMSSKTTTKHPEVSPLEITNDFDRDVQLGGIESTKASIEEQYHSEREQAKLRHWKESDFAAGLVEPTWSDELENYRRNGCCCCPREAMGQMFHEEIDPGCGCIYLSAVVCSRLGAGRIGNMVVLKERYVMVEADDDCDECEEEGGGERVDGFVDEDEGGSSLHQRNSTSNLIAVGGDKILPAKTRRVVRKREIQFVLGPFWPMLLFITYPLIFGVSALTLYSGIPGKPWFVQVLWAVLTLLLIGSLFNTGFRDPGILKRYANPPPVQDDSAVDADNNNRIRRRIGFRWGNEEGPWRWTDQVQSYRPKNSMYCTDCKVVIEEFDHT